MSDSGEYLSNDNAPGEAYTGNRKFHGVYLLLCLNPSFKGKTYIGYTVNPKRRIKQHNTGRKAGGAWKTSGRGPWEMVLIVHGFPSDVAGLRFEWAWQHPKSSRRLRHLSRKLKNESQYEYCLRIMSEMLRTGPWNRLPLTIQWLKQEHALSLPIKSQPPVHIPIAYGLISVTDKPSKSQSSKSGQTDQEQDMLPNKCQICDIADADRYIECCNVECKLASHIKCIADYSQKTSPSKFLLPVSIRCPSCEIEVLWGDLIYGKKSDVCDEG